MDGLEMDRFEIHSDAENGNGAHAPAVEEDVGRLAALLESLLFAAAAPVPIARLV